MVWIEPLDWLDQRHHTVVLACPNAFARKWVMNHYVGLIEAEIERVLDAPCQIVFEVSDQEEAYADKHQGKEQLPLPHVTQRHQVPSVFQKDFTFDQFVVGACNSFAYEAALAMACSGDVHRNALFLLSKTGLGKSHLSHAIANHVLHENSALRVCYVTAEDFTNAMVFALRHDSIEQFKEKYRRQCDVLLLEDIQFLSGKEKTQHELGYTLDMVRSETDRIQSGAARRR